MTDLAVTFGVGDSLTGVISQNEKYIREGSPIVIILNAGLLHKVGPFRLSVDIARNLAEMGYVVLRMDLSGVGDSRLRLSRGERDSTITDVRSAMDYLSNIYSIDKFILMGLCSGADNSHKVAVSDMRVVGTVYMDGYGYINKKYRVKHYFSRLFSLSALLAKTKMLFSKNDRDAKNNAAETEVIARIFPAIEQVRAEYSRLIARGMKMLHIYTRGVEHYYNYKNQIRDNLAPIKCGSSVEIEYYRYDDHTYSRIKSRQKVVERIAGWLDANY